MRPTPEGVGNHDVAGRAGRADAASMRPTPEGVGNGPQCVPLGTQSPASMRPTPEGVGNWRKEAAATSRSTCFNEAHARRRGKCHACNV